MGYKCERVGVCLRVSEITGLATLGDRYVGTKRTAVNDLARGPSNVRILTNTRVTRVRTTKTPGSILPRAFGVEYLKHHTGEPSILRARHCVVIAADHSDYDWPAIHQQARLLVDTRATHLQMQSVTA